MEVWRKRAKRERVLDRIAITTVPSVTSQVYDWLRGRVLRGDLPPGARIEVRRGATPMRLVRLHEAPFTDRLVAKFGLPVEGWRGAAARRRGGEGADA